MRFELKYISAVLALTTLFQGNAMALEIELKSLRYGYKTDCTDKAQRDDFRGALISDIQNHAGLIEKVPPDEAEYLRSETNDALNSNSAARMSLVMKRPYYYANKVHETATKVLRNYSAQENFKGLKHEAKKVISAIVAVADFKEAFFEYVDFDARRLPRVINSNDIELLSFNFSVISHKSAHFAKCLVDAIH